jgi:hypothetical protein
MKWVEGNTAATHTTHRKTQQMAKHRAEPRRTPLRWRVRRWQNVWYAYVKPDLRRRYRALQSLTKRNVENYIKKLR